MSIKAIHIILISCAVLLSFGFGAWCISYAKESGETAYQSAGLLSFAVAVALVFYGIYFVKKAKTLS